MVNNTDAIGYKNKLCTMQYKTDKVPNINKRNYMELYVGKKYKNDVKNMLEYLNNYGIPISDTLLSTLIDGFNHRKSRNYYEKLKNKNWITMDNYTGTKPQPTVDDTSMDVYNPLPHLNEYYHKRIQGKSTYKAWKKYKTIDEETAEDIIKSAILIIREAEVEAPYLINNALMSMERDVMARQAKSQQRVNKKLDDDMIAINVLRKKILGTIK